MKKYSAEFEQVNNVQKKARTHTHRTHLTDNLIVSCVYNSRTLLYVSHDYLIRNAFRADDDDHDMENDNGMEYNEKERKREKKKQTSNIKGLGMTYASHNLHLYM